ncbi:MAG: Mov34/MPN/PAD-1 family protein [Microcoleus sp.]
MQSIALSQTHLLSIRSHAENTYPEECCGLLLGTIAGNVKTLVAVWPTKNAWSAETEDNCSDSKLLTKKRRYAISPQDMLEGMKEGRDRNLEIIGIYHSHPDGQAIPSECDRTLAWPQYSYIIVSVPQGRCEDVRSWTLDRENKFQAEEILTLD